MMRFLLYKGDEKERFRKYKTKRAAKAAIKELSKENPKQRWKIVDRTDNSVSFY